MNKGNAKAGCKFSVKVVILKALIGIVILNVSEWLHKKAPIMLRLTSDPVPFLTLV